MNPPNEFQVIVIGSGHAGVEAARAAADALGARSAGQPPPVALVTLNHAKTGVMSCNPAIGGIAKGQMVREIDAMGGIMARAADATGIMFKQLNTSKGPAVRSPRAQCDRPAYARFIKSEIDNHPGIRVIEAAAGALLTEQTPTDHRIVGVTLEARDQSQSSLQGLKIHANAVVLTTGTFMRGLMHTGESKTRGGRAGEAPATGISAALTKLGFELGRLRTGTPPRLRKSSIDWNNLDKQLGDEPPLPFSDLTPDAQPPFPALQQLECRITHTTDRAHQLIRENLDRAPMYRGDLAAGPRYCPSIEDKAVRFADRNAHHVFLEPESHETDWVYCNGIATSLPTDIQNFIVHDMPGCTHAEILQWGYAVEYDMVRPHQIASTCQTKPIAGLFLAGQINGTSGYEEAAGQGLIAGLNAARTALKLDPVTLARDQAYIGVMLDDLVTKTPKEPYRMFTSRAEHRLLLRADNTADRLTPLASEWGLVCEERWKHFKQRTAALQQLNATIDATRIDQTPLSSLIKRPGYNPEDLLRHAGPAARNAPPGVVATVLAERQYDGYIHRQRAEIKRHAAMERRRIPSWLDYNAVQGLRAESRDALQRFRPETVAQAGRLEGVTSADIALVLVTMKRGPQRDHSEHTQRDPSPLPA
mgnify:CR=1 FL=1